jgi:hypothetical protein
MLLEIGALKGWDTLLASLELIFSKPISFEACPGSCAPALFQNSQGGGAGKTFAKNDFAQSRHQFQAFLSICLHISRVKSASFSLALRVGNNNGNFLLVCRAALHQPRHALLAADHHEEESP